MQNDEIAKYVADERARGVREEDIKTELLAKGWKVEDVNFATREALGNASVSSIPSGQLSSIGTLFSETWNEMQAHFSLIASIMVVPVILYFAASLGKGMMTPQDMFSSGLVYVVAQLAGGIILILATIGIIKQVKTGWKLSVEDTYKVAMPYFWPLVWASFLSGLVVIGGAFLFIVPGIILGVMLSFSRIAVVVDNQRGMNALMWSKELVRGVWWEVFKRLISVGLVLGIVSIILGLVPYIGSALSLLTVPFSMIFVVRLYDQLKAQKGLTVGAQAEGRGYVIGAMVVGIIAIPLLFIAVVALAMLGSYQNLLGQSGLPQAHNVYPELTPQENAQITTLPPTVAK